MTEPHADAPRRPSRGAAVFGALLAAAGIVWLLATLDAVPISAAAAVGGLLVLVGLAVALLPAGGYHGLLVALGVVLALLAAGVSALDVDLLRGGVGERRETPATAADAQEATYSLGIGSLLVDLTGLEGAAGEDIPVRASIGIGELVVGVPAGATLDLDARVAVGEVEARGRRRAGFDAHLETRIVTVGDAPVLRLELEGGIGSVRVMDGAPERER